MSYTKSGWYWCVHHNILLEWCYNYDERVEAIKTTKPENEVPTRLREFRRVICVRR